jgi:hypothetical protein
VNTVSDFERGEDFSSSNRRINDLFDLKENNE